MTWAEAEAALRAHIEVAWALTAHAAVPLVFANGKPTRAATFVFVSIEGNFAEKGIYGSPGKRLSVEHGIAYFHAFGPTGEKNTAVLDLVVAMTAILELQTVAAAIKLDGANPPSPTDIGDDAVPGGQPKGTYYRCSGSVPFIVIGTR